MADCLNNEEALNSQLSSTNTDAVNSTLDGISDMSSELAGLNALTSDIQGEETTTALLNEEEPLDSVLDQPTTTKYNGGETDNIVVSVNNSTHTITATLKPIKFKSFADFPIVGSDKLIYIDATNNVLYTWDADIGIYQKLVADAGDVDVDLSNYYTKEETYSAKEIDDKISNVEVDLSGYYTKTETDNVATQTLNSAKGYTDTKVAELIDSAPETLDTFKEIADAFAEDQEVLDTLNSAIGLKADKSELANYATKTELNTGLDGKVDKVEGKGLSTNDYTTAEKTKLDGIEEGANKTVVDDTSSLTSTNPLQNKVVTKHLSERVNTLYDQTIDGVKTFKEQPIIDSSVTESWYGNRLVSADAIRKYLRENYQEILVAGNNITFDGNTISANLEGSTPIKTLTSPVIVYDLPSGVYQLPTECMLYINSSMVDEMARVKYDNTSVALMVVTSITNPDSRVDKLFYLFAEADGYTADNVGNSGSFIVGKAKQDTGNYHITGTDIQYVTQETDGYINGNKSFVKPVKYYNQYESLDTSLNDRTLVDAQWVKSVMAENDGGITEEDIDNKLAGYLPLSAGKDYVLSGVLYAENGIQMYNSRDIAAKRIDGTIASLLRLAASNDVQINSSNSGRTSIGGSATVPAGNGTLDLGATDRPWKDIYGTTIYQNGKQVANKEDIPDTSSLVTTNTAQTITGAKAFAGQVGNTQAEAGVYLGLDANGSQPNANIAITSANTASYIDMGRPNVDYDFRIIKWNQTGNTYAQLTYGGNASGTITIPQKTGTMALTSDIPSLLSAFPVGSIYMSVSATSPASFLGGTWTQLKDRFLLGAGSSYSNGATGGSATHTLTLSEIPSHTHGSVGKRQNWEAGTKSSSNGNTVYNGSTDAAGGGGAHNNMPPYLVVYMWKRTA